MTANSGIDVDRWGYLLIGSAILKSAWKHLNHSEIDLPCKSAKPFGNIPKGLYILLQRYLLIHAHCFSIHNIQKMEVA